MTNLSEPDEWLPFEGPAWVTAAATLGAYGLLLLVMTVVLFGLPYLIFAA